MNMMNRFVIKTLGCKVNQSESENLAASFRQNGLLELKTNSEKAQHGSDRDQVRVCIINTCTVTEKASMQSRQAIRRAIRSYPKARIIVTGCYAQTQPEEILNIEGVTQVIPQKDKPSILAAIFPGNAKTESPRSSLWPDATAFSPEKPRGSRTRIVLKVQDGCNAHCTYCIVPKARGKSRSMPESQVMSNLNGLHRSGYREVVLSGIHLGSYGLDFSPPSSLFSLLKTIESLGVISRMRLSSIEPPELTDDLIELVTRSNTFCHHFHIPLQSGDDVVLRRMGRGYTRSFFADLVQKVHARIPDAAVGVDILVGFPGESDTAFENTFKLIDSLPVAYLHVFPFSPRKTTPAFEMPGKLPPAVIKERAARMRALGDKKRRNFHEGLLGRTTEVLLESALDASSGLAMGRTSNYIPVYIDDNTCGKNEFVTVKVIKSMGTRGVLASPISYLGGP